MEAGFGLLTFSHPCHFITKERKQERKKRHLLLLLLLRFAFCFVDDDGCKYLKAEEWCFPIRMQECSTADHRDLPNSYASWLYISRTRPPPNLISTRKTSSHVTSTSPTIMAGHYHMYRDSRRFR